MKNKISKSILILLVVSLLIGYTILYINAKNNVVFSTYNNPRLLLWGQSIEVQDYFSIKNDNAEKYSFEFQYDNDIVNQTQVMSVNVKYYGIMVSHKFEIVFVDEDKPVINFNNQDEIVSKKFPLDYYLEVYDQREWDKEIFYIKKQDIYEKYNGKSGYRYYDENNPFHSYQIREGLNKVHIIAWDGHGNTSEKDIQFNVE